MNNPDFEYIACLHIPNYKGQDTKRYIERVLGFDLEKFKAKEDIYDYLNANGNSYQKMLHKMKSGRKFVKNQYLIKRKNMEIIIKKSDIFWDNENARGSNIDEFFEVIDW